MVKGMRILVVEDEKRVASFIAKGFHEEGHAVDIACDGEAGSYQALAFDYDVVVLDVMLPKRSGFEVVSEIRAKKPRLPIIMLTAQDAVDSRITGLDRGADDYMVKPFAFAELSARIRALMRRGVQENTKLSAADLEMDTATRIVKRAGRRIDLTLKEYALLEFLLRHANRPVTRTMITEHVWDIHYDNMSNVVDVHVNSLRNKVDKGFPSPLIHTIRGVGYQLSSELP
jgi:two-component system, OmpR family, copper resistance phosphate regulon response regulator CusR